MVLHHMSTHQSTWWYRKDASPLYHNCSSFKIPSEPIISFILYPLSSQSSIYIYAYAAYFVVVLSSLNKKINHRVITRKKKERKKSKLVKRYTVFP